MHPRILTVKGRDKLCGRVVLIKEDGRLLPVADRFTHLVPIGVAALGEDEDDRAVLIVQIGVVTRCVGAYIPLIGCGHSIQRAAGFPGSSVKIADSTYEIHSDCNTFVTKNLGHVINEVWGPYKESLGGQLPNNMETLVISYRYSCDANYSNCANKEEFHVAQPYGLVKWQHQTLGGNGTYNPADNVTYFNKVVSGQTTPFTVCF